MRAGPWEIKRATNKKINGGFCVWLFDKQSFGKHFHLGVHEVDHIYNLCKKDARQCTLLRHPCILRIVEPIYETKNKIAFVSEGVKMTVDAFSSDMSGTINVDYSSNSIFHSLVATKNISELEIKFGLVCICEAVEFLHEQARLMHLSICPQSVLVGDDNSFKVCGFRHCYSLDSKRKPDFHFSDRFENLSAVNHPILEWTAPEVVEVWTESCSKKCDCFSFALLALWLLRGEKMIPRGCSLDMYNKILAKWNIDPGDESSQQLTFYRQLSKNPSDRPSMSECLACLSKDRSIQALLFLRSNANKTIEQKIEFLRACLQGIISEFGGNLTSSFLLPFVLDSLKVQTLRRISVQVLIKLCEKIDRTSFQNDIVPVINQLLENRNEADIVELAGNVRTFARFTGSSGEEMTLSILKASANNLSSTKLKDALEVIGDLVSDYSLDMKQKFCLLYTHICAQTDSGQVRLVCLNILNRCSDSLTHSVKNEVFEKMERIAQVDKSGQTSAAIALLLEGICAHSSVDFSSKKGLPLLSPMLSDDNLSMEDFQVIYCCMENILHRIGARKKSNQNNHDGRFNVSGPLSLRGEAFEANQNLFQFQGTMWQNLARKSAKSPNKGGSKNGIDQFSDLL